MKMSDNFFLLISMDDRDNERFAKVLLLAKKKRRNNGRIFLSAFNTATNNQTLMCK